MIKRIELLIYSLVLLLASNQANAGILDFIKKKNAENKEQEPKKIILKTIVLEEELEKFKSSLQEENSNRLVFNGGSIDFGDYLNLVRDSHPDLVNADIDRKYASSKRLESQGAFDPSITTGNFFNRFNSSSAPGETQNNFSSDTSFNILTRYGAKIGAGAKYAVGDIKTPVSPTGDGGEYYLKLQVPLIRDAIYNSKNIKEKSAKLNEVMAEYEYFRKQLAIMEKASNDYWDWLAAHKILKVEQELYALVNGQVLFISQQVDHGTLPAISIVEAEREVKKRRGKTEKAKRKFQEYSLKLSKHLWTESGNPYQVPSSAQAPEHMKQPKDLDEEEIYRAKLDALLNRPEFYALNLARDISDLEKKLAKNQMLPALDAYLSPSVEAGNDGIGPALSAGFEFSLPLRVRAAQGQMQQADLKIQKLNVQERQLIQNVFLEVEDAASEIKTSYQRYLAAKKEYLLAKELERGEKARFDLGDSTLFVVIRRQRSRVEANVQLIQAIADYFKAVVKFRLVQGELL